MLDLLFNANKFIQAGITIAIIIAIAVIIIALIKWPNGRIFIFTGLFVILLASGIYSGIKINYYTQTTGGIYGELTGLFKPNEVKIVNSTTFDLNNIELTQVHDDLYRARANVNEIVNLPVGYSYAILVNGMPCDNLTSSNDYAISNYTYSFLDSDLQTLKTDTLIIRFAFYQNSTSLQVETTGGAEAVKYWNEYFNKNAFTITLTTDKYYEDNVLDFGDGDISNIHSITYKYNGKDIVELVQNGSKAKAIELDLPFEKYLKEWTCNGVTFDFTSPIYNDIVLIPVIEQKSGLWQRDKLIYSWDKLISDNIISVNGTSLKTLANNSSVYDYGMNFHHYDCDFFIADGITEIEDYSFIDCSFKSLFIPDSVKNIGHYCIGTRDMDTIYLGKGLVSVGADCFRNYIPSHYDGHLPTSIIYSGDLSGFLNIDFLSNPYYSSSCFYYIGGQKIDGNLTIPQEVKTIKCGFRSYLNLRSLVINCDAVVSNHAFSYCYNLNSVDILGLSEISVGMFSCCDNLKYCFISLSVKSFKELDYMLPFEYCENLKIYCERSEVSPDWIIDDYCRFDNNGTNLCSVFYDCSYEQYLKLKGV